MTEVTLKKFAEENVLFKNSCAKANVVPTTRQASKFQRGLGIAYKVGIHILPPLEPKMPGYDK